MVHPYPLSPCLSRLSWLTSDCQHPHPLLEGFRWLLEPILPSPQWWAINIPQEQPSSISPAMTGSWGWIKIPAPSSWITLRRVFHIGHSSLQQQLSSAVTCLITHFLLVSFLTCFHFLHPVQMLFFFYHLSNKYLILNLQILFLGESKPI